MYTDDPNKAIVHAMRIFTGFLQYILSMAFPKASITVKIDRLPGVETNCRALSDDRESRSMQNASMRV
jgi:hypothetical protein